MKICLLADGQSIHTVRWCKHFFELGHEIYLISFSDANIDGIHVYHVNSGNINVAGGNWKVILKYGKVKKIIKEIDPDVLHSLYATSYGLIGALSGFHPYIVTPLGSDILISPNESIIYRKLLKYTFKKADWITSMAPHMKEAMIQLGVSPTKIGDIIFGINTEIFNRKKRKLSTSEFIITSTRNFEPVYNIPHFLKAIALLKGKIPNLKVIMLGDGSLKSELCELADQLKISDIITFKGKVPQHEVVDFLNQSHIFCTVSLSDGNSLSLLEAMACGAYPVATDIKANHEWIKEGINGNFVKIDDIIGLAERIQKVYLNFDSIIDTAVLESDKIIADKGNWSVNMERMNTKYKEIVAHGK
jgi:L-malate glycosyltransferase